MVNIMIIIGSWDYREYRINHTFSYSQRRNIMILEGLGSIIICVGSFVVTAAVWWVERDWLRLILTVIGLLITGLGGAMIGYVAGVQSISF